MTARTIVMVAFLCACGPPVHPHVVAVAKESDDAATSLEARCFAPVSSAIGDDDLETRVRMCTEDTCRFDIARAYFDRQRYERAGALLLQIARRTQSPLAAGAAELEIESMTMLGNGMNAPPRQVCFDLLVTDLPKLLDEFCTPIPTLGASEPCAFLYAADVEAARCSECTRDSISGRDRGFEQFTAARLFFETAIERCVFGRGAELSSQIVNDTRKCDVTLYRAADLYERAGEGTRAREVRELLLDPKNGLDRTESALRVKALLQERERLIRMQQSP
jgi:hypothetical protein